MSATTFFHEISRTVSPTRFEQYRAPGGSDVDALSCYIWNTSLAEALYTPLQILEVAYRNAVHQQIGGITPTPQWLTIHAAGLHPQEQDTVEAAKAAIRKRALPVSEPYLVAELSFGFWTSLLDVRYDKLWPKIIKGVFPAMPNSSRTRAVASARMNSVRSLRNAAMHHRSICRWVDLHARHADIHALLTWICPSAARMAQHLDRFPAVYAKGKAGFAADAVAISS